MNECPCCHTCSKFVYIGAIHVECPNENCVHFTEKAATLKRTGTEASKPEPTPDNSGFDPKDFLGIYDTEFD